MNYQITEVLKYKRRGRPKGTDEQVFSHYKLETEFEACLYKIGTQRNKLGRFILVTNDLNDLDMDEANMLSTYKEHQGVERGFRFIKAPLFHSSQRCFLKKPSKKPTLRWIFQKMSGTHRVQISGQDSCLTGFNKEKILRLFGLTVCRVYKLV
jgi:transposase